jgi:lysophospholipase L1-like esterase
MTEQPSFPVWRYAGGLQRTLKAIRAGKLILGFTGGSITDPRAGWNWPEAVTAWFVEQFPGVRISVENAGIGATGSELGVFRAQRDLINRGCDLVFVEYAVNDQGDPSEHRGRTREGLLRKLLAGEGRDIVLTYTYSQEQYADITAGRVPATVAELEELGKHYNIGSIWMGWYAMQEVMRGRMRWEEWLPDGLHPQFRGSLSYAQSVNTFLERELISAPSVTSVPTGAARPEPLNPNHWEGAYVLPFDAVKLSGPWTIQRSSKITWIDQMLTTSAVGARLAFEFEGRALSLGFDFGKLSCEYRYRLDGGEWQLSKRDRPWWVPDDGWYRTSTVVEDLALGRHQFELEVVHGNAESCTGTNCKLALIGIVP